jgi:hypothetical protein
MTPLLVAGLVSFLVVVFLEVSLLAVVFVIHLVFLAFADALLVTLRFSNNPAGPGKKERP